MYKEFKTYVSDNQLFDQSDRILVAVSGGIDSMVLLDLLIKTHENIEVAHVNYHLRGEDSDLDMELVQTYCDKHNIEYHTHLIDLAATLAADPTNLQAKARAVRYAFFKKIMESRSIDYIAIAHHSDDRIENFFLTSLRGTGTNGLTSMRVKDQNIVRPLLYSSRTDIKLYADTHNVPFREDLSNKDSKYNRNYMRNDVLPLIEQKIPAYRKRILTTLANIDADTALLRSLIKDKKKTLLTNHSKYQRLNISDNPYAVNLYFHILRDYGLNYDQVSNILTAKVGTIIKVGKKQFLRDRDAILIRDISTIPVVTPIILNRTDCPLAALDYTFTLSKGTQSEQKANILQVNVDKVQWPLTLRKWQSGDRFAPYGMNGKSKSIKKFLIDKKINVFEKESVHVLISNNTICAVLGIGVSEKYKIGENTEEVLTIKPI